MGLFFVNAQENQSRYSVILLGSELNLEFQQVLSPSITVASSVGMLLAKGIQSAAYNSTLLTEQVGFMVN